MYYEETGSSKAVWADDTLTTGRILVVDDDAGFGQFAATALESRGHHVDWAGSLGDAFATLYGARYDLTLIDLHLPDGSGLDLLRRATDAGLLAGSSAIILTGHQFEQPDDIRVFHKPLAQELEPFLDRMSDVVAITKRRRAGAKPGPARATAASGSRPARKHARVELVLYTSASSEKCQRALRTVQQVLREYDAEQVHFTVTDLAGDPDAGDKDAVVFTPTLVKRGPGARTYIVGNLDEPQLVSDLLDVCGVKRLRGDSRR
jgi:CheY-like chemotaxis protein